MIYWEALPLFSITTQATKALKKIYRMLGGKSAAALIFLCEIVLNVWLQRVWLIPTNVSTNLMTNVVLTITEDSLNHCDTNTSFSRRLLAVITLVCMSVCLFMDCFLATTLHRSSTNFTTIFFLVRDRNLQRFIYLAPMALEIQSKIQGLKFFSAQVTLLQSIANLT